MGPVAQVKSVARLVHAQVARSAPAVGAVPMAPDFPAGPVPDCSGAAPDFTDCSLNGGNNACSDLVIMDPRRTDSYWDYPLNGETSTNQYRSYLRRDLALLLIYASDQTHCLSQNWDFGNREPIGLGDMSEADGAVSGTAEGDPGHPVNTHTNGFDIDIGYYQIGMNDNLLRPICNHIVNGQDQYHCTDTPDTLDVWRTALYLGKLHDSPCLRVIGVDGKAGADIMAAFAQLCAGGYLEGRVCEQGSRIGWPMRLKMKGWAGTTFTTITSMCRSASPAKDSILYKECPKPSHTMGFLGDTMVE